MYARALVCFFIYFVLFCFVDERISFLYSSSSEIGAHSKYTLQDYLCSSLKEENRIVNVDFLRLCASHTGLDCPCKN